MCAPSHPPGSQLQLETIKQESVIFDVKFMDWSVTDNSYSLYTRL